MKNLFSLRMLLLVALVVVAWHMLQTKRGAISGPLHKPKAGPGTTDQMSGAA